MTEMGDVLGPVSVLDQASELQLCRASVETGVVLRLAAAFSALRELLESGEHLTAVASSSSIPRFDGLAGVWFVV